MKNFAHTIYGAAIGAVLFGGPAWYWPELSSWYGREHSPVEVEHRTGVVMRPGDFDDCLPEAQLEYVAALNPRITIKYGGSHTVIGTAVWLVQTHTGGEFEEYLIPLGSNDRIVNHYGTSLFLYTLEVGNCSARYELIARSR